MLQRCVNTWEGKESRRERGGGEEGKERRGRREEEERKGREWGKKRGWDKRKRGGITKVEKW